MELGNLTGLLWGLLAIPIVVFYLVKTRLRRVPVPTVMFWDQVFEEKRPRAIWQRLRHLVSLLVQLLFLALVVGALCDPSPPWQKREARRIVLVVDVSASMGATDVAPTRFARAQADGLNLIASMREWDEMAIVEAGSTARVACGLTSHQRSLRRALDGLRVAEAPGELPEAVRLARRVLGDHPGARLIVLSDGCFPGADALADAGDIEWSGIGGPADNVAITRFQARRSLLDPIGYQILVEVTNFGRRPVACRLEFELDDDLVDVVPLELEPGRPWTKVIEQTAIRGGRLIAQLDVDDALPVDNRAVALLPERKRQPVVLVSEGNVFLEGVFRASSIIDLTVSTRAPERLPAGSIAVFHRRVPTALPPGNVLVIDPIDACDLWNVGEALESPIVTEQDADSPLMTHVRLDNLLMPGARKLDFTAEHRALASSVGGEPIYAAIERPEGNVLVLSADLSQGDLPLRTAFPIMMTNAVAWFQGVQGELREAVAAGSTVEVDLGPLAMAASAGDPAVAPLVLRAPDGSVRPVPASLGTTTIGPLDRCGVWTIERREPGGAGRQEADGPTLQLACNLTSPDESDLRSAPERTPRAEARVAGAWVRPMWFYLVAGALIVSALEWLLYQRRWIS